MEQEASPFVDMKAKTGPTRTAHWFKPELIGQFRFASRTDENRLRHAAFEGLREDKPAKEVKLDKPISTKIAISQSNATAKKTRKTSTAKVKGKTEAPVSDASYDAGSQQFAGVRLTSPEKVLYPDSGITKLDLAAYYHDIADWILPHVVHRPIVLVRCPEGQQKECFYQKHPTVGTPESLHTIPIKEKHRTENYIVIERADDLISLAQIGALEIHAWGSKADKLEFPDRLIFDLDPAPDVAWKRVVESAFQIRDFLGEIGLPSFVKTTGGKGLHLVVPIDRRHDWDQVKEFCKKVAEAIEAADPTRFVSNMSKAKRTGKIFVDYLRNGRGATAVVPYSTRAKPGATVSTPLSWKELLPGITSDHFTIQNIRQRLNSLKKDPWEEMASSRVSLTSSIKKLSELTSEGE